PPEAPAAPSGISRSFEDSFDMPQFSHGYSRKRRPAMQLPTRNFAVWITRTWGGQVGGRNRQRHQNPPAELQRHTRLRPSTASVDPRGNVKRRRFLWITRMPSTIFRTELRTAHCGKPIRGEEPSTRRGG